MFVKGYRGSITVEDARKLAEEGVYAVNCMCVGGKEHLIHAYTLAKENFKSGRNVARNFHFELMRILSGRRQIKDAVALCGTEQASCIAVISEKDFALDMPQDDAVLDCAPEKIDYLGITAVVQEKPCDAFFENSAMVELER
ncbi:MAG: hypothetical protein GXO25_06915 [Euryarchaeota archaeon]|nr:hypothetical protein [Euryarchaeota archaeon]